MSPLLHPLRNAALQIVTLIGLQMGIVLSGTVTVEFVFAWPGIGNLTTGAVFALDLGIHGLPEPRFSRFPVA